MEADVFCQAGGFRALSSSAFLPFQLLERAAVLQRVLVILRKPQHDSSEPESSSSAFVPSAWERGGHIKNLPSSPVRLDRVTVENFVHVVSILFHFPLYLSLTSCILNREMKFLGAEFNDFTPGDEMKCK